VKETMSEVARQLSGATRLAIVIGDPVRHSLSPALHNAAFNALGLDWVYVAAPVPAGQAGAAVEAMRTLGIEGMNVTMPHKQGVFAAVDRLAPEAQVLGAVNCVSREGGLLVGENTDGPGLVRSIREDLGIDPGGLRTLIVGAGGAANAAARSLADAGAHISVTNRTADRAEATAEIAGPNAQVVGPEFAQDAELIIQATSVGMSPEDPLPLDPGYLSQGQYLVELIYHPTQTPLLAAALERGVTAVNGTGMLLHQAAIAFTHWTGEPAPLSAMREVL
jgi:shikimate dehydrogenase